MYSSFGEFFGALCRGEFGFTEVWRICVDIYTSFTKSEDMVNLWNTVMGLIDSFYVVVPYILIALSLVVAFFEQKLMPVLKFIGFFFLGFVCGVHFIGPLITPIVDIPLWISGLVVGIVAAVIYRFLYFGAYGIAVAYCVYVLCYTGFYMREGAEHTLAKSLVCLAIAIGAVIVAFIFIKHVEIIGTSMLGAYLVSFIIRCNIWDFRTLDFLASTPWVGAAAITVVLAIPAAIVQYSMKTRY
ncbi:MAG: hypothetical protein IJ515_04595 [Clostridia bacterium]|nr:hypothetical protein [Clostridia bacterium]